MRPLEAIERGRIAFLYELYTRSAGDAGQGIPYEELVDAPRTHGMEGNQHASRR
jgi:hypothetical protein